MGSTSLRGRSAARPALRPRPRDRRGRGGDRARALGRPRQRRDAARARSTRTSGASALHPLQTFTRGRGPEQLDGAFAAVTAETARGARVGTGLARTLGLEPFELADGKRAAYHAGAAIAVELSRHAAARRRRAARGRRRAARGARAADAAHDRQRLRADRPDLARRLGDGRRAPRRDPRRAAASSSRCTARSPRRRRHSCEDGRGRSQALRPRARHASTASIGLVPTMGALPRRPPGADPRGARRERRRRRQPLRQPGAVRRRAPTSPRYPRDEARDAELAADAGRRPPLRAAAGGDLPAGLRRPGSTSSGPSRGLEGDHRPGHFRGVATVCLKLFNIVRPQRRLLRPEGRPAGRRHPPPRPRPRPRRRDPRRCRPSATRTASRSPPATCACPPTSASRPRPPPRPRRPATLGRPARERRSAGLDVDYVEIADFDPARPRRRGPRRLHPPDRQRRPREETVEKHDHPSPQARTRHARARQARRCPSSRELKRARPADRRW